MLIKTECLEIGEHTYTVCYYEMTTPRGTHRYSSEIVLGAGDRVILDDDSVSGLGLKLSRVVPLTVCGRLLAARVSPAA
jgi:hypothetical protein